VARPFPWLASRLNAFATLVTCQWLMGPSKLNDVEIDGGKVSGRVLSSTILIPVRLLEGLSQPYLHMQEGKGFGVLVDRCRYLEQSGCAAVCVNSCKVPTQEFFATKMGLPLTMTPNYENLSCQ
jgi:hypothetical protein